jgi:hypothetical protein
VPRVRRADPDPSEAGAAAPVGAPPLKGGHILANESVKPLPKKRTPEPGLRGRGREECRRIRTTVGLHHRYHKRLGLGLTRGKTRDIFALSLSDETRLTVKLEGVQSAVLTTRKSTKIPTGYQNFRSATISFRGSGRLVCRVRSIGEFGASLVARGAAPFSPVMRAGWRPQMAFRPLTYRARLNPRPSMASPSKRRPQVSGSGTEGRISAAVTKIPSSGCAGKNPRDDWTRPEVRRAK